MPDKHTCHCNTPDGFNIPCPDLGCGDYVPGPQKRPPVTQHDAPGSSIREPDHDIKESDQCIRVDVPGEGFFTITKDVAELWLHQITIQLENLGPDDELDDESGEMPLDSENPTPLVGMD